MTSAPLPHVQEALRPYIHDRQETLRIRQTLADFLHAQFPTSDQHPLNHLTLAFPRSVPNAEEPPLELTALRKKYWEAVKAQAAAKQRRDALKAELNQLQRSDIDRRSETTTQDPALPDDGIKSYIALLQQRSRHRKLHILQSALDQIVDTEPNPTRRDLQQWLKDRLGDAPLPPPEPGVDASLEAGLNDQVLRLKKELLHTKHGLDEARKLQQPTDQERPSEASLETQVYALRCARDELINWIEAELAKLADQDPANEKAPHHELLHRGSVSDSPYQEQVATLYSRYISTRASLVTAVEAVAAAATSKDGTTAATEQGTIAPGGGGPAAQEPSSSPSTHTLPASEVLAYAPSLLQAAKDERALLHQTTYLRHEVAKAQEAKRALLQRLASESHLVAPSADSALFWARAARDAASDTEQAVVAQLGAGEASLAAARAVVADLEARKSAFNALDMGV